MGQAPAYLVIGNGRVARHMRHYLSLLHIPHDTWHRGEDIALLRTRAGAASHILVLIRDDAIEGFIKEHLTGVAGMIVHFSGALVTGLAFGAHPLMTFGQHMYDFEAYAAIPFVLDDNAPPLPQLLPGLPNPHARLERKQKAYYHAMCSMAGNFTCLLWQKFFDTLQDEFGMPPETGHAYLRQQAENLLADYKTALTGPLARGDTGTVENHIKALRGDAYRRVYKAFAQAYEEEKKP